MRFRFATSEETANWDKRLLENFDEGNIFQTTEMASVKAAAGWTPRFIVAEGKFSGTSSREVFITIHERRIFGVGKLWYMPKGPGVSTTQQISKLLPALVKFSREYGAFVVKIEPELLRTDATTSALNSLGLIYSGAIQPNSSTVVLDVSRDLEAIMTDLPQKGRHAIRRAQRDGIITKLVEPTPKNLAVMLRLMKETMSDKSTLMRADQYYVSFWKTFIDAGMGGLFLAYDGKTSIAGAFVMLHGRKATYKDGGSVRRKTIYGASHALQWEIIQWLKLKGVITYDLCGTPPPDRIGDQKHPHYGIGLFKTSFKKEVIQYVGVYDVVVNRRSYKLWTSLVQPVLFRINSSILKRYFY